MVDMGENAYLVRVNRAPVLDRVFETDVSNALGLLLQLDQLVGRDCRHGGLWVLHSSVKRCACFGQV